MRDKCIRLHKYNYKQVQEIVKTLEFSGDKIYKATRDRITNYKKFPLSFGRGNCNTILYTEEGWMGHSNNHTMLRNVVELEFEEILRYHPDFTKAIEFNGKLVNI